MQTVQSSSLTDRRSSHVVDHNAKGVAWIEYLITSAIAAHDLKFSGRDARWQKFNLLNHARKVASENEKIGRYLGESEEDIWTGKLIGLAHDYGKLEEVCEIYRVARKLTAEELTVVRTHPIYSGARVEELGGRLNRESDDFLLKLLHDVAVGARGHHEGWIVEDPRLRVFACRTEVTDCFVTVQEDREIPGKSLSGALAELDIIEEYLTRKDPRHRECMGEILETARIIKILYTSDPHEVAHQLKRPDA